MGSSIYRNENLVLLRLLRQYRTESGMTQGEFARALNRTTILREPIWSVARADLT